MSGSLVGDLKENFSLAHLHVWSSCQPRSMANTVLALKNQQDHFVVLVPFFLTSNSGNSLPLPVSSKMLTRIASGTIS